MITAITVCLPPTPHQNTPRYDACATAPFCCHGNKTILPPSVHGFCISSMHLVSSETHFRALLKQSNDAIQILSPNFKLVHQLYYGYSSHIKHVLSCLQSYISFFLINASPSTPFCTHCPHLQIACYLNVKLTPQDPLLTQESSRA